MMRGKEAKIGKKEARESVFAKENRVSEDSEGKDDDCRRSGSDSMFKHSNPHRNLQKKGEPTGSSFLRAGVESVEEEVPE